MNGTNGPTATGDRSHFDTADDCPWCCIHLSGWTLRIAQHMALEDGFGPDECIDQKEDER